MVMGVIKAGTARLATMVFAGSALSVAAAALSLPLTAALGVQVSPQTSDDTRDLILAPLRAELLAARPQYSVSEDRFALASGSYFQPSQTIWSNAGPDRPRPAAARLAATSLSAAAGLEGIEDLAVFQSPGATLLESESGSRLSVALLDRREPDAALLALSDAYAEIAGSPVDPAGLDRRRMALRYEVMLDAPGGADGLDFGLVPRAGVSIGQDGPAAEAGATVRLGQFIGEGFGEDRPAWWLFAGADRQAVLYDPGQGFNMRSALAMEPYAMVGDAQAGIAARFGGADFSLAYVQRETRYALPTESWDTSEGFAALSLTWRR